MYQDNLLRESSVLLVYIPYTIFAPIFAIVGLVVWVMGY